MVVRKLMNIKAQKARKSKEIRESCAKCREIDENQEKAGLAPSTPGCATGAEINAHSKAQDPTRATQKLECQETSISDHRMTINTNQVKASRSARS